MDAQATMRGADFLDLDEATTAGAQPLPQLPLPILIGVSGFYERSLTIPPLPAPVPIQPPVPSRPALSTAVDGESDGATEEAAAEPAFAPPFIVREELRLDVDGRYPLMTASGAILFRLTKRVHWIARLTRTTPNRYTGSIWYKNGDTAALPQTMVTIDVSRSPFPHLRTARITFAGGGAPSRTVVFRYASSFFRRCELEYDVVQGTTSVTKFDTSTHPNKPASLPNEVLSIDTVYQRAGVGATVSSGSGVIPILGAGTNQQWSDAEMHDAMVQYWSHFANAPQWAAWVLFASLSESGASLGGIMFDSIGPNHRQGTAIFEDSFISTPPVGDPNGAAAVQRVKFWTAVHEIGHTFNLAHAWQKSLGTPWIPLADEPLARSFMNYPYRVPGGATSFFADFEYRFSDGELLFMRHAPERFVEQGFADWFDHHGFQQALEAPEPTLQLILRAQRTKLDFEFLEPVVLELKLTNVSAVPQIVDGHVLQRLDHMTVATKRQGSPARVFQPFARYCYREEPKVLMPGESIYESLFLSVGENGWIVAEPGRYVVQLALHDEHGDVVSNPLSLRITPPTDYTEELLAQDVFTEDVGRVLTFDGSRELTTANDVLQRTVNELGDRRIATHARVALGLPMMKAFKSLRVGTDTGKKAIDVSQSDPEGAMLNLNAVLRARTEVAAETLGHVDMNDYTRRFTNWLAAGGLLGEAAAVAGDVADVFEQRGVRHDVVETLQQRRETLLADSGVRAPRDTLAADRSRGPRHRPSR